MAKRRTKARQEKIALISRGYSECRSCKKMLKPDARRCPACGAMTASAKRWLTAVAVIVMLVVAATAVYTFYPREDPYIPPPTVIAASPSGYGVPVSAVISVTFNRAMDADSVEASFSISPSVLGSFSWSGYTMSFRPSQALQEDAYFTATVGSSARDASGAPLDCGSYIWSFSTGELPTVRRGIGTGPGDFWTVYPASHPSYGQPVEHPDWALSSLERGVTLILDHSSGCYPCVQQTEICESVRDSFADIEYLDLLSGMDEPMSSEAFAAYDPNDAVHYVPLTILITKALNGLGEEVVAWHSWEGVVDLETLRSWVQDARSYYEESV